MSQISVTRSASWLDILPAHWNVVEPRRIFTLRREAEHPDDEHLTPSQKYGVLPQKKYMEITGNRVVQNLSGTKMQHVEPGDFISHLRTFQGGLELSRIAGKISPAYTVVTPRESINPEYYKYALKSQGYISQISSVTDQLRDGQSMRYGEFNLTPLPVPPALEQKAIADYLDHETAEIDALTKDLISLQELTSEELEAKREYLLGLSEPGLIWTRLKFLSNVTVGIVVNPSAWYVESGVPALRGTNVKSERMVLSDLIKISKEGHAFHRKSALSAGDVVIVRTGQAGTAATVPKSLDGSNAIDLLIAKPGPSLSGNYLAAYINSSRARHQFQAGTVGAIQGHFNVEDLKNLEIPVMSLCEQTARINSWAAERKKAHALVEAISSAVQLTRERRAALITAAVTGQIDVTARNKPAAEQLEDDIAQGLHREN